ncbi:hypothetical protein Taro_005947 [Colocasia esculenta]|uniref:ZF-HD dimerization-type domain-containing protein n=1 Tax=Colocasia esculenta TaxID=4460 RepID=A0A843TVZ5_COLES|nr:hypothetical protein [Colocasia esculenta]
MELRGHDDDSDGDDFLPQHRRLGLGRLYQEGELGSIAPSSAAPTTLSSLNYNHSGILASGSAFRRPPIFPSPLSSSTLSPSAAATPPSSFRQSPQPQPQPQPPHQKQHGGVGRGSPADTGENSHHKPPPVQLPSSLDPKLSLVEERSPHQQQQQQQQQQGETRKDQPDAASPRPLPTTASGPPAEASARSSSSNSRTEAAAALPATKSRLSSAAPSNSGKSVRYRECLKNHAARVGGHVLDGCGEFMPGGEEGTPEAIKCAACTCHRSFHRKEVEGGEEAEGLFLPVPFASSPQAAQQSNPRRYYLPGASGNGAYPAGGAARCSSGTRNVHNPSPLSLQTPSTHGLQQHTPVGMLPPNSGGNDDEENTNYSGGTTTTESSSEEMQAHMPSAGGSSFHHGMLPTQALQTPTVPGGGGGPQQQQQQYPQGVGASASNKKRFRTKFTAEQKEMMSELAERVGWRMQKQDEAAVGQFCRESGVSRQVFKVWMHNNKHALLKSKQQQQPPLDLPTQGEEQQQQKKQQQQQQQSSSSS